MNRCQSNIVTIEFLKIHQAIVENHACLVIIPITRLHALVKALWLVLPCGPQPNIHLKGYGFTGMRITGITTPVTRMYLEKAVLSSPAFRLRKRQSLERGKRMITRE